VDWKGLVAAGVPAEASDERIWGAFLREMQWLHGQMNAEMRHTFAPLFALFEIKTIVLCLRNRAIDRTAEVKRLLRPSLLGERLREILLREKDVGAVVATFVETLAARAPAFRELQTLYAEQNLKGFENGLMRAFLEHLSRSPLNPALRRFFVDFTDLRNILLLYKRLRWEVGGDCRFIFGGSVQPSRLQELLARKDSAGLDVLLRILSDRKSVSVAASEGALETVLLRGLTKRLEKKEDRSEGVGCIAAYLWRAYAHARNLAVLHHGKDLDARTLERELIA
jgi:vacuolar-type H+-ATPase subunit C/Vma6